VSGRGRVSGYRNPAKIETTLEVHDYVCLPHGTHVKHVNLVEIGSTEAEGLGKYLTCTKLPMV